MCEDMAKVYKTGVISHKGQQKSCFLCNCLLQYAWRNWHWMGKSTRTGPCYFPYGNVYGKKCGSGLKVIYICNVHVASVCNKVSIAHQLLRKFATNTFACVKFEPKGDQSFPAITDQNAAHQDCSNSKITFLCLAASYGGNTDRPLKQTSQFICYGNKTR